MRRFFFIKACVLFLLTGLAACKKDKNNEPEPNNPDNMQVINSDRWITVASDQVTNGNNIYEGRYATIALNQLSDQQLRWMYAFSSANYINDHREFRVSSNGKAEHIKSFPAFTYGDQLKSLYDGQEWQLNAPQTGINQFTLYKNGTQQDLDAGDPASGPWRTDLMERADDGFFITEKPNASTEVAFFSFQTATWKRNVIPFARQAAQTRWQGKTYAVATGIPGDPEIQVYRESDSLIATPGHKYYLMNVLKSNTYPEASGFVIHSARYGNKFYVATTVTEGGSHKYKVFRFNLETGNLEHTQVHTQELSYPNPQWIALNNGGLLAIDEAGNLYVVENRIADMEAHFSIRKYKVGGGSELVLPEEALLRLTEIQAIRYFNGKLYAALIYAKENGTTSRDYFMRLVRMK